MFVWLLGKCRPFFFRVNSATCALSVDAVTPFTSGASLCMHVQYYCVVCPDCCSVSACTCWYHRIQFRALAPIMVFLAKRASLLLYRAEYGCLRSVSSVNTNIYFRATGTLTMHDFATRGALVYHAYFCDLRAVSCVILPLPTSSVYSSMLLCSAASN